MYISNDKDAVPAYPLNAYETKASLSTKTKKKKKEKKQTVDETRMMGRALRDANIEKEKKHSEEVAAAREAAYCLMSEDEEHPDLKEKIKKNKRTVDRRVGEGAASIESYHDDAYRRGLHQWGRKTLDLGHTSEYVNEKARIMHPSACAFGVLKNPIAEYPDDKGEDFMQYREKPQYLLVCSKGTDGIEEYRKIIAHLHNNFDDLFLPKDGKESIVRDNCIDLDVDVMGLKRPDLYAFIRKESRKVKPTDLPENAKVLQSIPAYNNPATKEGSKSASDSDSDEEVHLAFRAQANAKGGN